MEAGATGCDNKATEGGLATGKMFRSIESGPEARVEFMDKELMQFYKIPEDNNIPLAQLAIIHHKTWLCIIPKKHTPKVPVATPELRSMLSRALDDCKHFRGQ